MEQRNTRNASKQLQKKKKVKKKPEFSKILLIIAFVFTVIITVFSMIMIVSTGDTTALEFLIVSAFAELATASGFYYSKAKAENRIKLRKRYGADIYNDSGASDT